MTVKEAIERGSRRLGQDAVAAARLTSELLLAHVLGRERVYLYANPERSLLPGEESAFEACLRERLAGRPTQYITGVQEFYGREFRVTPDVMIPRPETEFVVQTAAGLCGAGSVVVDAGTGSGAIAVSVQLEAGVRVVATDISRAALLIAQENARRLRAAVSFVECDLLAAITSRSVDLVLSNPPYVPDGDEPSLQREVRDFEPRLALYGGPTGLDFYRRLIGGSLRVLKPGGWLIVECGIRQAGCVRDMLGAEWRETRVVDDLAGLPRVLASRYWP